MQNWWEGRERARERENRQILKRQNEKWRIRKRRLEMPERGKLEVMEIALEAKVKGSVSKGKTKERN